MFKKMWKTNVQCKIMQNANVKYAQKKPVKWKYTLQNIN